VRLKSTCAALIIGVFPPTQPTITIEKLYIDFRELLLNE
jgi:hypothetical protein